MMYAGTILASFPNLNSLHIPPNFQVIVSLFLKLWEATVER